MPELTDSYCERCGTRHVFAATGSKGLSLRGARVLAKGLKNFVLNDGQSMGDSITSARLEDESSDSSRMTEAFHKAFNFCMTCRQYACDKCWNAEVSACLSCAPQADSAPVAPEGRLIVRTPVTRWDADWLDSADPGVESAVSAGAPSLPAGPTIEPKTWQDRAALQAEQPTTDTEPVSWPAADVLRRATAGPGKSGRPGRKGADPGASSLWPAADELAPEMTLTYEEMMLVEAELSHQESGESAAASAPLTELAPAESAPAVEIEAATAPTEIAAAAEMTAPASTEITAPAPAEMAPVTAESRLTSPSAMPPTPVLAVQDAPSLPSRPEPAEPVGFVARLLGRHGSSDKAPMAAVLGSEDAGGGVPTQPWPHPTPWAESPMAVSRRLGNGADEPADGLARAAAAAGPAAEQPADLVADLQVQIAPKLRTDVPDEPAVTPVVAPEPEYKRTTISASAARKLAASEAPLAVEPQQAAALGEARSAAAIRQSAVTGSATRHPDEVAEAAEPAAQLEAEASAERDAEVAEIAVTKTGSHPTPAHETAAEPPAEPSSPPVAWPPFGASWPAPDPTRGTWPGPVAPLPAVVAARQLQAPLELGVWAQSSQEVMNRGTVRVCHRCSLPVSTQARFCRRCGTHQA